MKAETLIRWQLEKSALRLKKALEGLDEAGLKARPQNLAPLLWQVGHVAASDWGLLNRAGSPPTVPAYLQDQYRKDTKGENLTQSSTEIWAAFDKIQAGMLGLAGTDLDKPVEHPAGIYSSVGEGLFYMLIHRGYHHGKMMTLRSLLGKS